MSAAPDRWLSTARRALTVMRGYSAVGLIMAVVVGALSVFHYKVELSQWICRLGAMGCLVGAASGLNIMDRLVRGKRLPVGIVAGALAVIAVALVAVGVGAVRNDLGAAWSPLLAATYIIVLARITLRFRSSAQREA